jgi:tRNA(Arg) A34 adenosine deaminase TadA
MTTVNADFVAASIETLGKKLFAEVDTFAQKIPEKHEGKAYRKAVLAFTRQINKLEKTHQKEITDVANQISALQAEGWEDNQDIVRLWHDFALALTAFSEHPSKKVATVIISENNELQAYGTNRIPANIVKRAEHFIRGIRSSFIICSERMAIANFLGISIKPWWKHLRNASRALLDQIEKQEIQNFSDRIIEIGKHSADLHNSTMITTTTPCNQCACAIAAHKPKLLITNGNSGHNFTRHSTFIEGGIIMRASGVTIRELTL